MSGLDRTLRPEYFDALYAAKSDPWNFAASPYEHAKYTVTANAMPKPRYRLALEVGCSIGILTRALASRCDAVLGIDAAETPLAEARRRCADLSNVRFERMFVPDEWPDGAFELIVLSEFIYYLCREDVARLAVKVMQSLSKGGSVILVHWTGETNYPLSGDEAAALFIERIGSLCVVERAGRHREFRLDVLSRD
jgi:trans-aconitate methyltransferase